MSCNSSSDSTCCTSTTLMDNFSVEISRYYTSSRPYEEEVIEKDRLCNYIVDCGKYLQKKCETEMNEMMGNKQKKEEKESGFLHNMIRAEKYRRNWDIFRFGSESWGTSCCDSDIDMGIFVNFRNIRPDKKYLLSQLARIISENDNEGLLLIKPLLNARYPIIRIFENRLNIKIDVSIADRFCKARDELVLSIINKFETKYNIEIKPLIVFIKYWSKQKRINNAYQCYLNSFGYTLLTIFFVQFHLFIDKQSNKSLSFLVYKLFEFYATRFKPEIHSICIDLTGNNHNNIFNHKTFNKEMNAYCLLEIHDPINPSNNVAQRVGIYQMSRIKQEFINAFELIKAYKDCPIQKLSLFDLLIQKNCNNSHQILINYQFMKQLHDEQIDQDWRERMIYSKYERDEEAAGALASTTDDDDDDDDDEDTQDNDDDNDDNESSDEVRTNDSSIYSSSYVYDGYVVNGNTYDDAYNYSYYKPKLYNNNEYLYDVPYHKSPFRSNNDRQRRQRRSKYHRHTYV